MTCSYGLDMEYNNLNQSHLTQGVTNGTTPSKITGQEKEKEKKEEEEGRNQTQVTIRRPCLTGRGWL